jgi:polyphosphate kinase
MRYVHLSTGNYNSSTAKLYTDLGLFTADDAIGRDVATIFNLVTGFDVLTGANKLKDEAILSRIQKLAIAPVNLRQVLIKLIEGEIDQQKRTGSGFIMAKMNALVDKDLIDALYKASQAGVKIHLLIRGICCLKPGIPGVSQNIEVVSVVDRFLEHSRIFYFQAGGEHKIYLSSADWMPRNMDRRIEICWPIENKEVKARLINEILRTSFADTAKGRLLQSDGRYARRKPEGQPVRSQLRFIEIAREGGIQSIPYEVAIRHNPMRKHGQRPIAKKKAKDKKTEKVEKTEKIEKAAPPPPPVAVVGEATPVAAKPREGDKG